MREAVSHTDGIDVEAGAPAVSVIMPAYRVAEYIAEAIDSVVAQTVGAYEVIVINDGSPDTVELERVLEPYRDRVRYIRFEQNRGLSAARNAGILAARGRYIALLDPDDTWEPNYLEVQLAAFRKDPGLSVVYPNARLFGNPYERGLTFMDICPSRGQVTFESLLRQECNVMISVLAVREAIVDAGLFDEDLTSCEDFDLWLRILKRGARIGYHRQILANYRRRPDALSANGVRMCGEALRVLEKVTRTMDLNASEAVALARMRRSFVARLRLHEGKRDFERGDWSAAIAALAEANRYFRSLKLDLVLLALRTAPGMLLRVYELRDRLTSALGARLRTRLLSVGN